MLHEEVALYKKLTGSNEENIPIMKIGAYLDGYDKGLEDAKPKWIPVSERLPKGSDIVLLSLPPHIDPDGEECSASVICGHYIGGKDKESENVVEVDE